MRRYGNLRPAIAAVLLGVVLVLTGAATPAAAAAPPDSAPPTLVDIEFTPDAVAVAGLALVPVTVNVHLTDESGVQAVHSSTDGSFPFILVNRVSGGSRLTEVATLSLTSGTIQDGVWSASVQVPSTWNGQWQVTTVVAVDTVSNKLEIDPRTTPIEAALAVTGTHQPALMR
jgi:hypothetical protein